MFWLLLGHQSVSLPARLILRFIPPPPYEPVAVWAAQEVQLPLPLPEQVLCAHHVPPGYPLPGFHPHSGCIP